MARRRHKKGRQAEEPRSDVKDQQQTIKAGNPIQERSEDFQTAPSTPCMLAFIDIEHKASLRLQEVARMVDELLKIYP